MLGFVVTQREGTRDAQGMFFRHGGFSLLCLLCLALSLPRSLVHSSPSPAAVLHRHSSAGAYRPDLRSSHHSQRSATPASPRQRTSRHSHERAQAGGRRILPQILVSKRQAGSEEGRARQTRGGRQWADCTAPPTLCLALCFCRLLCCCLDCCCCCFCCCCALVWVTRVVSVTSFLSSRFDQTDCCDTQTTPTTRRTA